MPMIDTKKIDTVEWYNIDSDIIFRDKKIKYLGWSMFVRDNEGKVLVGLN